MPALYFAGLNAPRAHGPGPLLSIMAGTPPWARVAGHVDVLKPVGEENKLRMQLVAQRRGGKIEAQLVDRYRGLLEARWALALERGELSPGALMFRATASSWSGEGRDAGGPSRLAWIATPVGPVAVFDGSTLACVCSAQESAAGRCHRRWAARLAFAAGWDVWVDGERFNGRSTSADRPRSAVPEQVALFRGTEEA